MQTDGQTDKDARARHWKTGVFDVGDNWATLQVVPPGWTVYKKLEVCPTTGKDHYQVHVDCGNQQRLSALSKLVKLTKWVRVYGKDHITKSINYISKSETTAPGARLQIVRGEQYLQLHELLLVVARSAVWTKIADKQFPELEYPDYSWKNATRCIVYADLKWITKLSNPVLSKLWDLYRSQLCEVVATEIEGGLIIEPPEAEEDSLESEECLII